MIVKSFGQNKTRAKGTSCFEDKGGKLHRRLLTLFWASAVTAESVSGLAGLRFQQRDRFGFLSTLSRATQLIVVRCKAHNRIHCLSGGPDEIFQDSIEVAPMVA